jgi:hypothetical protein
MAARRKIKRFRDLDMHRAVLSAPDVQARDDLMAVHFEAPGE